MHVLAIAVDDSVAAVSDYCLVDQLIPHQSLVDIAYVHSVSARALILVPLRCDPWRRDVLLTAAEIDPEKVLSTTPRFRATVDFSKPPHSPIQSSSGLPSGEGVVEARSSMLSAGTLSMPSYLSAPSESEKQLESLLFKSRKYPVLTGASTRAASSAPSGGRRPSDATADSLNTSSQLDVASMLTSGTGSGSNAAFAAELLRLQYAGKDKAVALAIAAGTGGASAAQLRKQLQAVGGKRVKDGSTSSLTTSGANIVKS